MIVIDLLFFWYLATNPLVEDLFSAEEALASDQKAKDS